MTKVSVIIPVYNVEKYLRKCLDSILGQTLREIEVICVDDGSSDSSPAILAEYAAKDPRLKVLTQANSGAAAARNVGLAAAKGEYLYFCDPDDWAKPQMLEKLSNLADQGQCDVVVASVFFYSEALRKVYKIWTGPKDLLARTEPFSARDVADRVFRSFLWSPWNKLLRRSFVEHHRLIYQNLPRCNDIAFNATATALAERILFDKSAYYYYRTDVLGSATALRDKHPNTHALAWDEVERRLKERGRYEPFADDLRRVRAIGELNTLKLISDAEVFAAHYACVRNERMPRYGFSADDFRAFPEAVVRLKELEAIEKYESPLAYLLLRNSHLTKALAVEQSKRIELQKKLRKTKALLAEELEKKQVGVIRRLWNYYFGK